jgi:hypothetical protein
MPYVVTQACYMTVKVRNSQTAEDMNRRFPSVAAVAVGIALCSLTGCAVTSGPSPAASAVNQPAARTAASRHQSALPSPTPARTTTTPPRSAVIAAQPAAPAAQPAVTSAPPAAPAAQPAVTSAPPAVATPQPAVISAPPAVATPEPAVTTAPPVVASASPAVGSGPALPSGVSGTFVSEETGAQLFADPSWQKSSDGQIAPSSSCTMWSPATMTVDGTYLDMFTPGSPSWDCVAIESDAAMTPGHIWQLSEYIPALANGDIADYPGWWLNDNGWSSEIDMAEANDWVGNTAPQGQMCLDIHLTQGTDNTTPNCVTEAAGWHTYTLVWAANGNVTMYYDGIEVSPIGVAGSTATDMHMIIWNNNNGGIDSTLKLAYLAEWNL